ncbi:transporter substrate-binding domain-containing protein [Polaromonas sp. UC242_47]|uniref:transporter substrate-binding domain-containing protein n=1 Tax=Polaromonas sp. UC242_47 TaxID=3374626 RepID=UPI003790D056
MLRRQLLVLASAGALLLAGCAATPPAADPSVRQALAPSGALRVGVYPGSPSSTVTHPQTGEKAGVTYQLGQALAQRMGVPVQIVEYERLALVVDAVKTGAVDVTFTNASEVRARDMNFTPVLLQVELGYLLPLQSTIASVAEMDKDGRRLGVSQGSSSQAALARLYKNKVTLVPANSLKQAQDMLRRGEVEAFATNKGILSEMLDSLPGFKILPGSWGVENMAIAIPKGREAAMPYVRQFAQDMQSGGQLQSFIAKAGLRGTRKPD